jgi:hypothetical protein
VDSAQVGILEQANKIGLSCFLKSEDGSRLETKIRLEVLGDLTNKALERSLSDEKVSGLLVLADFAEGDSSGAVAMGLLDTTGGGGRLAGSLKKERRVYVYVRSHHRDTHLQSAQFRGTWRILVLSVLHVN